MGNSFANARRTGIVPMACIAAITAAVVGCSSTDKRIDELHTRGFIDIATIDGTMYDGIAVYYGTVDNCRVKLTFDTADDNWTAEIPVVNDITVGLIEPTASTVRDNPAFDYCTSSSAG